MEIIGLHENVYKLYAWRGHKYVWRCTGFVAQIFLWPDSPLPQTDLAYGHCTRYAKNCEAVQDRGTDLDLRNLPIEVARREALTE
jgi:hypothetical protein